MKWKKILFYLNSENFFEYIFSEKNWGIFQDLSFVLFPRVFLIFKLTNERSRRGGITIRGIRGTERKKITGIQNKFSSESKKKVEKEDDCLWFRVPVNSVNRFQYNGISPRSEQSPKYVGCWPRILVCDSKPLTCTSISVFSVQEVPLIPLFIFRFQTCNPLDVNPLCPSVGYCFYRKVIWGSLMKDLE